MNITGRCDYACRAMLELAARHDSGVPVSAQVIAQSRGVPEKYLTQIMLQLKRAGLVRSVRGAQGGYALVETPDKVSLLQILEAVDGPVMIPGNAESSVENELADFWRVIAEKVSVVLSDVLLQQMVEQTARPDMFHI